MSELTDSRRVSQNIKNIYEIRKAKLYALAVSYAGRAINEFRSNQGSQAYWTNQTSQAFSRMFSRAFVDDNEVGFFLSHGVKYGVYLELANDRRFEAIRPIMISLAPKFIEDARKVLGGSI